MRHQRGDGIPREICRGAAGGSETQAGTTSEDQDQDQDQDQDANSVYLNKFPIRSGLCLVQLPANLSLVPEKGCEPVDVAVAVEAIPVQPQLAQPLQGGQGGGEVGKEVVLDAQHLGIS